MLNLDKDKIKILKELYNEKDMEESSRSIRKRFISEDGDFSVFNLFSFLDTMVILHDDKGDSLTRFVTFKDSDEANYLILSVDRTVEEMRFDAACMLRNVLKRAKAKKGKISLNCSIPDKDFSREDKHFACALLMPEKELMKFILKKDENGFYKYLSVKGEISFKNINAVADYFGVPFGKCSSRIFHVFEKIRKEKRGDFYIEGCSTRSAFKKARKSYSNEQMLKDMSEVCPNYSKNSALRINHLLDSLHYRSYSKLSDVAKRRLLINLAKFDSVNEGVVKSEEEAKSIINNFIASGGTIKKGKLIAGDNEYELSDEQLVVLGEYTLYNSALSRGFIRGIAKSDPRLADIVNLSYKEALERINERDIARYVCDLHRRLFSNLTEKYDEQRGGFYRNFSVNLAGTQVSTADPHMINQLMENVSWRILDTLKKNADNKLSNSEYIDTINECIYEMIRMQPFGDGNKRTARLLSNILYQEKGIPFVLLPVSYWDEYVDAWSAKNVEKYNELMHQLILESYSYFYGTQSVNEAVASKVKTEKIITANVGRKK